MLLHALLKDLASPVNHSVVLLLCFIRSHDHTPLNHRSMTNYLSRWLWLDEDQYALDEADLGVEVSHFCSLLTPAEGTLTYIIFVV